ncbi:MAG: N-acetylmuramoyl-L-alanine amidase [Paludisphaera borealis]|uniref:N-acetylmuramoyl-L-alanine amidase n=1 Tax=Paludisphaera borealis TaxID=1387353 RepID=UPI002841E469|nr:N-acetylmuramoyl-L-alanine amidase [Paludisphaera borealis]MDR3620801.1 N-acetylmuramoyl-L-alanine amidase [Paludisphaera borealis]
MFRDNGARPILWLTALTALVVAGLPARADDPRPGEKLGRRGDEIVVCGQLFHTTAPVVLWIDPGGYDAYRVDRRFVPPDQAGWEESQKAGLKSPVRFGLRKHNVAPSLLESVHEKGWTLPQLQEVVDQFVLHFDARGTSRECFQVLHDQRGLSVQFMLDLDGTIYQTMDLKEAAWHATKANSRSVGIEIANIGAYPVGRPNPLSKWYAKGPDGHTRVTPPGGLAQARLHNPQASLRPSKDEPVVGVVQGGKLEQYDFTPEQYDSLIKLTATLSHVFPKIKLQAPRDASGQVVNHTLPPEEYNRYQGVLGHFHVQNNKTDPGPALQWDKVINGAKALVDGSPEPK